MRDGGPRGPAGPPPGRSPGRSRVPHTCPRPVRLEVLSRARYFAGLGPDELGAIDARMQVQGYAAGEPIYRAGDEASHLFVLAGGEAKLVRPSLDGQDVLVDVVLPGTLFGTLTMLGEPTYPDSAESLTDTCALRMSADEFRDVLRRHPTVALNVLDDVTHRLEDAHRAVHRLSGGTVEQRVAGTLLALADKLGEVAADGPAPRIPLSRSELAAMTGTTTESVSRVMSRLRREGIIDAGRRWTAVADRARLADLAERR